MGELRVSHEGGDRFRILTRGHAIRVDQPLDAGGDDSAPTPLELFVASVASCQAFYARRFLARHGVAPGALELTVRFDVADQPPARVAAIRTEVVLPHALSEPIAAGLLRAVEHCTVANSIRFPPDMTIHVSVAEAVG